MAGLLNSGKTLRAGSLTRGLLLSVTAVFLLLHFVHLRADFPNDSPWMDWSKYTDEGWYSDAASRHYLFGHWYLPGDFNPAVALPMWPLLEAAVFRFTGVSLLAARVLAVVCFSVTLASVYLLLQRFPANHAQKAFTPLAAPVTVLLMALNPFFFAFDRLAILEPPLMMLSVLALLAASCAIPWQRRPASLRSWIDCLLPQVSLGALMTAMVLTKTTALAIFPALLLMLWRRAASKVGVLCRLAAAPLGLFALLLTGYLLVAVRPHYWEDYQYLFSANAYTGFQLQPLATVLANTFADGQWMGGVLYAAFFAALMLALFGQPRFFHHPLVPALLAWVAGYFVFLAYHNNLQPRYYLLLAVPITMLVGLAVDQFRNSQKTLQGWRSFGRTAVLTTVLLLIVVPDALLQVSFLLHPEYTYLDAARSIAQLVRADRSQPEMVLSVSGSDLTLMTGLPSIDDDFGTLDLDQRVRQYKPGWYVAWNEIDDDKMDALTPLYRPVRVATFPALDDPDRNQLILYRLDPATSVGLARRRRRRTPRPLRTKLGQQPTTTQLQH